MESLPPTEPDNSSGTISSEILSSFNCPISHEIMNDPVICTDGQTYNRSSIENWFLRGNRISPLTGAILSNLNLIPNIVLRSIILSHFPNLPPPSEVKVWVWRETSQVRSDNENTNNSNGSTSSNWLHPINIPRIYNRLLRNHNNWDRGRRHQETIHEIDNSNNSNISQYDRIRQQNERLHRYNNLNNIRNVDPSNNELENVHDASNNEIDNDQEEDYENNLINNILHFMNEAINLINTNRLYDMAVNAPPSYQNKTTRILNNLEIVTRLLRLVSRLN